MLSQLSVYSLEKLAILFFLLSRSLTITFIYLFLFFFCFYLYVYRITFARAKKQIIMCFFVLFHFFVYSFFFIQLFSFYPSSLIHFSTCMYTSFILRVRVFCVLCTCIMPRILRVIVYVYVWCEYLIFVRARVCRLCTLTLSSQYLRVFLTNIFIISYIFVLLLSCPTL